MDGAAPCPAAFYALTRSPLERALPRLLERARQQDLRALVRCGSAARAEALNGALWTYSPGSFLAHGGPGDARAAEQPIWLAADGGNPNAAQVLILIDGTEAGDLTGFSRCLDLFDGADPDAAGAARARWRRLEGKGHPLAWWTQDAFGAWRKRPAPPQAEIARRGA